MTKIVPMKAILKEIKDKNDRELALGDAGELLLQAVLDHVGGGKSPVSGGRYKKSLSKDYKKQKKKLSSSSIANMELSGDMLDSLDYQINTKTQSIEIGYFEDAGSDNIGKADNHNKFTSESKRTKNPYRQHIPRKNERFTKKIMKDIFNLAGEYASED